KFEVFAVRPSLFFDGFMEPVVNAFERRGLEGNDVVYVVGGFIDIRVTEHDNDALSSSLDEPALGFEHRDQRSFTSNQRARQVEASVIAGDELIEVVAGDAARDGRIFFANEAGVMISQRF